MNLGNIALGIAAIIVLVYIWWRTHHLSARSVDQPGHLGHGLTDEAVAALEDVAEEFLGENEQSRTPNAPTNHRDEHPPRKSAEDPEPTA